VLVNVSMVDLIGTYLGWSKDARFGVMAAGVAVAFVLVGCIGWETQRQRARGSHGRGSRA